MNKIAKVTLFGIFALCGINLNLNAMSRTDRTKFNKLKKEISSEMKKNVSEMTNQAYKSWKQKIDTKISTMKRINAQQAKSQASIFSKELKALESKRSKYLVNKEKEKAYVNFIKEQLDRNIPDIGKNKLSYNLWKETTQKNIQELQKINEIQADDLQNQFNNKDIQVKSFIEGM